MNQEVHYLNNHYQGYELNAPMGESDARISVRLVDLDTDSVGRWVRTRVRRWVWKPIWVWASIGFGRPFGFGFGAPFVGGLLGGLALGSLVGPGYGYGYDYGYPYYPPYPYYPYYPITKTITRSNAKDLVFS